MSIHNYLTAILAQAFESSGYNAQYGTVTTSNRPDLCQYQCNGAMAAAKSYKQAPLAIANAVAQQLSNKDLHVTAVPPGFVNITLSDAFLADFIESISKDERLGLPLMEPKTIVIDYGGANVAKPLHVGHLRSAILGDTLRRLAKFLGHEVIGDVHLGDWGLQMGMVIAETRRRWPALPYFDADYTDDYPQTAPFTIDDLNTMYPEASARAKVDETFAMQAAQDTVELQSGRRGLVALWQHICMVSIADLKMNYGLLGVHFDKWLGESDAAPYIPKVIASMHEQGLLYESEGMQVMDVSLPDDPEPIPPMLVVKSNGGVIYGTTDVATIYQRMEDWQPDEIWYVVDNRQSLHFKQVFRAAKRMGLLKRPSKLDTVCTHFGFGTMNGTDGKPFKTREGGVMQLSDLIQMVTDRAFEKSAASEVYMTVTQQREVARIVGVAALKIGDMNNHRTTNFVFDLNRFLASDGRTGPYLLYTAVRINWVLRKADAEGLTAGAILPPESETERALMLSLLEVPILLLRAFEEKTPNTLCEALFNIAGVFNRFYYENRILTCPDPARRSSWLALLALTRRMLEQLLDILGIDVPERM